MSPKKQNHACFTTISKDNSENDIYANQTKCIGKFGDVFYNGLYILGPKTFKKLPFLLCHIYGQHCKIRLKMVRMLEKILIVDSAKDR